LHDVVIVPVSFGRTGDRRKFVNVPWRLYPRESLWVPPLRMTVHRLLRPENPFYRHADAVGFIARVDGQPAGRIAAIVNRRHNEFHGEKTGFFGFFECADNVEVAAALLDRAAAWLRERGMDRMRGPVSPSTNDECGLLVQGFEFPPAIMMPYNPPYYVSLLETYGCRKAKDLHAYRMLRDKGMSERLLRLGRAVERRTKVVVRPIDLRNVHAELGRVKVVYNAAWERNWGFVPMTDAEFAFAADDLKQSVGEGCALIAEDGGAPVGFALALLDLNQFLRRIRSGRLLPLGIFTFLRHRRKIDAIRIITLGVIPSHRRRGIEVLFYNRLFDTKYAWGEMSWVLEDNREMNEALDAMGAHVYKTYRLYDCPLTSPSTVEDGGGREAPTSPR
jgi:GNAT superfamily N-acetyltransferase